MKCIDAKIYFTFISSSFLPRLSVVAYERYDVQSYVYLRKLCVRLVSLSLPNMTMINKLATEKDSTSKTAQHLSNDYHASLFSSKLSYKIISVRLGISQPLDLPSTIRFTLHSFLKYRSKYPCPH